MTWAEMCNDKRLRDLPYKIELNRFGKIEMSPTRNLHGYYASTIARLLKQLLAEGESLVECGIETLEGTKVADAAWASAYRFARIKHEFSCSIAPEICVEVLSPSKLNLEIESKRRLYLAAGAKEYWTCDEDGRLSFFDEKGTREQSLLCPSFPKKIG
jgi:Uma2 family endonuclease